MSICNCELNFQVVCGDKIIHKNGIWSYQFSEDLIPSAKAHLWLYDYEDEERDVEIDERYIACSQHYSGELCHCLDETREIGLPEERKCKNCLVIETEIKLPEGKELKWIGQSQYYV